MAGQKRLRADELSDPELLTVEVGVDGQKKPFKVPRVLLCDNSKYFEKAFTESFAEGQNRSIKLEHVKPWIFEVFVGWLYSKRITALRPRPSDEFHPFKKHKTDDESQSDDGDEGDEQHPNDPITWIYEDLFDLYMLADYLDSKDLRNAIMEILQLKIHQRKPRQYYLPCYQEMAVVFTELPDSSPLYRFLVDLTVFIGEPEALAVADRAECLPASALVKMLALALQLARMKSCKVCNGKKEGEVCTETHHPDVKRKMPDFWYDLCVLHEHEGEEEREACRAKWEVLRKKHALAIHSGATAPLV